MASLDDLMSQIPLNQVAKQLGVDEATAASAVRGVLPALVGGLQANARDSAGAQSLARALGNHGSLLDDGIDVAKVDTNDGAKIVSNIFGGHADQVAAALGKSPQTGSADSGLIAKLMPILAPIVMAYLAKQAGGNLGGGPLGDLLGGILGGAAGGAKRAPQSGGGGVLGSVLESVLGGKKSGSSGGVDDILGNVLGGLLGGGKR